MHLLLPSKQISLSPSMQYAIELHISTKMSQYDEQENMSQHAHKLIDFKKYTYWQRSLVIPTTKHVTICTAKELISMK